jgi:ribose transport system substrate-binding protein/inositol transport system substrate-binding protein
MALGALKAVEDAQLLDKIKIYGLDATPDALAAVKDGKLAATVSQAPLPRPDCHGNLLQDRPG